MVRGAAALLTAPVLATAYFAVAPALPDLGDGDLSLLVADGIGLIAIAATVWSLLPAWRAQNVLAFVLLGAAVVTGILNLAGVGALANVPEALAVPLFVAAIDIWSVASGPTSRLVDAGRDPVDVLSFDIPAWGGGSAGGLGLTDAIFLAMFAGWAWRFGLRRRATLAGMTIGLLGALVLSLATDEAIPALPLVAAGYLLPNVDRLVARVRPA